MARAEITFSHSKRPCRQTFLHLFPCFPACVVVYPNHVSVFPCMFVVILVLILLKHPHHVILFTCVLFWSLPLSRCFPLSGLNIKNGLLFTFSVLASVFLSSMFVLYFSLSVSQLDVCSMFCCCVLFVSTPTSVRYAVCGSVRSRPSLALWSRWCSEAPFKPAVLVLNQTEKFKVPDQTRWL